MTAGLWRRVTGWLLVATAALVLIVIAAGIGGWIVLRGTLPRIDGVAIVSGIAGEVEIRRDAAGIPHIFAGSPEDAYFGLGWVHAQDRLWQMEMGRRAGAGRLSEIFGDRTLASDRYLRTLGAERRAESAVAALDPRSRTLLDGYVAGVNAAIDATGWPPPPEFLFFRHRPEPWRAHDSTLLVTMMALQLDGNARDEVLNARLEAHLGYDRIAALLGRSPSVSGDRSRRGAWTDADFAALEGVMPASPRGLGSNNWAVSGERSLSGRPLLANDPHLGLEVPGHWYLTGLHAPGLSVVGATLPGIPVVVVGRNARIAWGVTNTGSDVQDLFVERISPDEPSSYLTPDGPRRFDVREEVIAVRGADAVVHRVRESRHGPIVSDSSPRYSASAGDVVALAWNALDDDLPTLRAGFELARAGGWDEFVAALSHYAGPQQNFLYADIEGAIGFYAPGRIPIRRSGDGTRPTRGWTGEGDWIGFVPFEELPHRFAPPEGWIATANDRIVGDDYPHHLALDWAEPYRVERIGEMIEARDRHTPESFAAMQTDIRSGFATAFLPHLRAARPETALGEAALAAVADWSGDMDADDAAPLVFSAWYRELSRLIYADELGPLFADAWDFRPAFVGAVLSGAETGWCDDAGSGESRSCAALATQALDRAAASLASLYGADVGAWRWGDAHPAVAAHSTLGGVPLVGDLVNLATPHGGGPFTVMQARYRIGAPGFREVHGVSLRAVFDLADPDGSRVVLLTGQSGNPMSPRYDDMFVRWRNGDTVPLPMTRERIEADTAARLTLRPGPR